MSPPIYVNFVLQTLTVLVVRLYNWLQLVQLVQVLLLLLPMLVLLLLQTVRRLPYFPPRFLPVLLHTPRNLGVKSLGTREDTALEVYVRTTAPTTELVRRTTTASALLVLMAKLNGLALTALSVLVPEISHG